MTRRALLALILGAMSAGAQQRPRGAAPSTVSTAPAAAASALCPAPRPRATPTAEQRRAARELAQRAQQAAILGDRASAREQLRQAAILDPRDPDLAYQLARANDASGAAADAASEYCRFLSLAPNAPEAPEARERVAILAPPARPAASGALPGPTRLSPTRALSLGLAIPGAGQFYTGRPVAGALAFGAAAAAVACAASQRTSFTSVQETALDPFGNPYTYTARRQTSSRPCLVPGLAAAGAIAVTSAIEAFNHARRANDERRLAIDLYPNGTALAFRVTVR
jgi:TM2 domain-containing membrane protein YozV